MLECGALLVVALAFVALAGVLDAGARRTLGGAGVLCVMAEDCLFAGLVGGVDAALVGAVGVGFVVVLAAEGEVTDGTALVAPDTVRLLGEGCESVDGGSCGVRFG